MINITHILSYTDGWRLKRQTKHILSQTTNTATVLHFVFIGMTPSAAFVNASSLVGDAKRLHSHRLDGYLSTRDDRLPFAWFSISGNLLLFAWFSIPLWIHPCKSYIYQLKHGRDSSTWTNEWPSTISPFWQNGDMVYMRWLWPSFELVLTYTCR